MALTYYGHPFSSYTWKGLIALWENGTAFTYKNVDDQALYGEMKELWPLGSFPVLVDDGKVVFETSVLIEYLQAFHPGPAKLIPDDPALAIEVRLLDRIFDLYVMANMQAKVGNALRPADAKDPHGVEQAMGKLMQIYAWLDKRLAGRAWAAGEVFTLADCAAAPSLFYADWVLEIPPEFATLRAYRARLLAHPSVKRAVDEARPYRGYFPLGAPDRD